MLCPAVGSDTVLVVGVEAGLLMAPLYRLRKEEATADVAVVSMAWKEWRYFVKMHFKGRICVMLINLD